MTHPTIFLYVCLSFILGIFFGSFLYSFYLIFVLIIFSLFIVGILWKKKNVLILFVFFFLLGYVYVNSFSRNIIENDIVKHFGEEIEFRGKIKGSPKDDLQTKKAIVCANARILVYTNKDLKHNDEVLISGKLEEPQNFDDFNYKMYLASQGISGIIKNAKVEVIKEGNSFLHGFKGRAKQATLKNLSINKAGILNAIILGETDNMNSELKQKLGYAGISHIVAISGQHIVLLCMMILYFLNTLKIERRKSIVITFFFLVFYIFLIDFPASATRAFIMMSFILFAELLKREGDSFRSLVIAAILILVFNPLTLFYNLGFQLSFLAVLGIMIFNDFFKRCFSFIKNEFLIDFMAINFSAQVLTLPLLIYTFNYVSLSFLITNMLVVPILPVLLILGFLCLILPSFSFLFFTPISLILGYVLFVVDKLSFMIIEINNFPLIFLLTSYLIIGGLIYKLKRVEFYL